MTLNVYYYLFKCILVLVFIVSYFNYKLNLGFLSLGTDWLFQNPFSPHPLFQRKFNCQLSRNVEEPDLKSGQTTCKMRLNDIYEFIYIWVTKSVYDSKTFKSLIKLD